MLKLILSSCAAIALIVALALNQPAQQANAVGTPNMLTAGGAGVFPAGATFSGVQLAGGTFGIGVQTNSDGTAKGDLELQLNGNSPIGLSQWITITGWITDGTVNTDGTMTLNGTCTVDMGDGTPPIGGLSLVASVSLTAVTVTVGSQVIPTLPKSDGWVFID
ncbi:MAG TPA: hypothetical protein VEP48_00270 [Methylomirabilota bacterium]|nr:hypothetical protein [Methylomirabilota bacterium]